MTLAPPAQEFRELVVGRALRAAEGGARTSTLRLAGQAIRLDVADDQLGAALLPALRQRLVPDVPDATTRIVIWSEPLPDFPWGAEHLGRGGTVSGLAHGPVRAVAAADGSALMLWDEERRLACCWFDGLQGVRPWDRGAPLRTALHYALAGPRRRLVHGAVVGHQGRGVLLAGPGGSGKSTTTLACWEAGLQIVGDDYSAVEVQAGGCRAWNLYSTIKVGERGPGGRDERRTLVIGVDLPGETTEVLDLVAVLVPEVRGGADSSLEPVGPALALRALAPSTLLQAPVEARPDLGPLSDVARDLPAYRLLLGADRGVPAIRQVLGA